MNGWSQEAAPPVVTCSRRRIDLVLDVGTRPGVEEDGGRVEVGRGADLV